MKPEEITAVERAEFLEGGDRNRLSGGIKGRGSAPNGGAVP